MYIQKIDYFCNTKLEKISAYIEKMKRILTSILLLLVLTISVHPIISMHFCNGVLHSFTLASKSEADACCVLSDISINNNFDKITSNLIDSSENCCSFKNVEIITDNFTLEQTNTTIQKPVSFTFIHASAILDYLISLFTPDAIIKSYNPISAIGLHSTTLKFLSYICVYRL